MAQMGFSEERRNAAVPAIWVASEKRAKLRGPIRPKGSYATLAVAGVSLLLLAVPMLSAAAVTPHLVLSAPFKGTVVNQNNKNQYGCGSLRILESAKFKLYTGIGGFSAKGKAAICPSNQFGLGSSSSNQANGEFQVATPIHVPPKTTHVVANLQASWDALVTASDAGKSLCTQGNNWENTQYYANWNYVNSTSGPYYANNNVSWSDRTTYPYFTLYQNGTQGNSPTIHPWHFNSTTSFQWYQSWGGSAYCDAYAAMSASYSNYLFDETNGTYISQTGNTLASSSGRQFFNLYVHLYNSTSWSCSNATYWDGPSNKWSNTTMTCSSYNNTVVSYATMVAPTSSSSSGHNNTVSLGSAMSITGSWYWNYTFVRTHHYELFFDVQLVGYCGDTWSAHGFGAFSLDMGGASNGFRLISIAAT